MTLVKEGLATPRIINTAKLTVARFHFLGIVKGKRRMIRQNMNHEWQTYFFGKFLCSFGSSSFIVQF